MTTLAVPVLGALCVCGAFLSGSVPFSLLIGLAKGVDIRTIGSGNVGATNLGRALGRRFFFLGFALDMLKGLLPVLGAGWLLGTLSNASPPLDRTLWWIACASACVLGHVFSPWLRFKGGKGVATGFGAMLGVYPCVTLGAAGAFLVFLLVIAMTRIMSLSSMIAAASMPFTILLSVNLLQRAHGLETTLRASHYTMIAAGGLLGLLVIWTHRANIARMRDGTEPRLGRKPESPRP